MVSPRGCWFLAPCAPGTEGSSGCEGSAVAGRTGTLVCADVAWSQTYSWWQPFALLRAGGAAKGAAQQHSQRRPQAEGRCCAASADFIFAAGCPAYSRI